MSAKWRLSSLFCDHHNHNNKSPELHFKKNESRTISNFQTRGPISSEHVTIFVFVLWIPPHHTPLQYGCPFKTSNRIRPTYLQVLSIIHSPPWRRLGSIAWQMLHVSMAYINPLLRSHGGRGHLGPPPRMWLAPWSGILGATRSIPIGKAPSNTQETGTVFMGPGQLGCFLAFRTNKGWSSIWPFFTPWRWPFGRLSQKRQRKGKEKEWSLVWPLLTP